jgi:hypothetical protein
MPRPGRSLAAPGPLWPSGPWRAHSWWLGLAGCLLFGMAQAGSVAQRFCDLHTALSVQDQSRLLRVAAITKDALQASGAEVALVSRSGLDLERFGVRYSHAGLSLREGELGPWSIRQLYYACEEGRPRVFDQGLAGFVAGTDDIATGFLSIVLLPPQAGAAVQAAARDNARAVRLLGAQYSANAYAYSVRYQNCNQWLMELLATAWGQLPQNPVLRETAQAWLWQAGYRPAGVSLDSHLWMAAAHVVPWINLDDHPEEDRFALRMRTSLPRDIETFVHQQWPDARRIEVCHAPGRVVVRQGWEPISAGCHASGTDQVFALD